MKTKTKLLLAALSFCAWQNNSLTVASRQFASDNIPAGFDGFKIVQLSDLHGKWFGREQARLLSLVKRLSPDILVITGDLIDRRRLDVRPAAACVRGAVKLAPVYFVSGNHEAWSGCYPQIRQRLTQAGATVLDDDACTLERRGDTIQLLGLSDPGFLTASHADGTDTSRMQKLLRGWESDGFQILLSHRPELFDLYRRYGVDLTFAGHAHGGQVRLPVVGGLYAPEQGILPAYTSGCYRSGNSALFVSRGLGNSLFPARVFNRPEIVCVTLRRAK